jgi:RHS repeat-associated protein
MLMTNESGSVVWEGEFLPFGEELSITGSITNNLRFPGQYYDVETGLHQNWHRDYKPEVGRYIQFDPMLKGIDKIDTNSCSYLTYSLPFEISQELNPFVYTENNPINLIDPRGLVCGSGLSDWVVPDRFPSYDFTRCCQRDDECYGCEGEKKGLTKSICDIRFCNCLRRVCDRLYGYSRESCEGNAKLYCKAVKKYGGNAFRKARERCCN